MSSWWARAVSAGIVPLLLSPLPLFAQSQSSTPLPQVITFRHDPLYLVAISPLTASVLTASTTAAVVQNSRTPAKAKQTSPPSNAFDGRQGKPDTASTIEPLKLPINIIDLVAGYTSIRNPKTLVPHSFLYLDLSGLDTERYVFVLPEDPESYRVTPWKEPLVKSPSADAAAALGQPIPKAASSDDNTGLGDRLMGKKQASDKPYHIERVEIIGKTARLTISGVTRGDQLQVALRPVTEKITEEIKRPVELRLRGPVTVTGDAGTTFSPSLKFVSDQQLSDGTRKSVIQVPLTLDVPSVNKQGSYNAYLRSQTLISSSNRDPASRINLTYGLERNAAGYLPARWLGFRSDRGPVPGHIETRFDANQSFSNAAITLETGIRGRVNGGSDPLWSATLRTERSTIAGLDGFLEYRLRRDLLAAPQHAGTFNIGFSPFVDAPLRLGNLRLQLGGRLWALPFEQGANGVSPRYLEYQYRLGIIIPLPKAFGGDRRLRIDYLDGANPSSGYIRTRGLQFQLEGFNL